MYDFADRDHAANYLTSTIIRWGGKPTYVSQVDWADQYKKKLLVGHYPLREMAEMPIPKRSLIGEFDFKPVPLGMYNFMVDGRYLEAAWLMRMPARRWKVGLDKAALTCLPVRYTGDNVVWRILKERPVGAWWHYNSQMADCIEGKYPSLDEALDLIGKRTRCSVAFSRSFAVTGDKELVYKHNREPVGRVAGRDCQLFAEYADLNDVLVEELRR